MKSTTQGYKNILASGAARKYLIKIDLTLANNTVLHLTESDIWEDSFAIETASSGTSSFDIGCAVIGKCTFTINNINGTYNNYDFFNATATVWLGIEGDKVNNVQQYYRMGFFTVDEPQKANGLISLTLLDNMWKFDVPFSGVNINYPTTALAVVQAICSYCGVSLAGTSSSFHGYNISITEAPSDNEIENMNCREVLQYMAMLGCNFCIINSSGTLDIKWYDTSYTSATTDVFDYNQNTSFGQSDITITGAKFVIDKQEYTIGSSGYVLELENPFVNTSNVTSVLNSIWSTGYLKNFTLRTFNITTASDLAAEIGDRCKIKDYKGNYVYSWITTNSFKLAAHLLQCNAEPPNRTLVKRYSKSVQAAVEIARQEADERISNYDLAVQMMNSLAVNAMGGYEEYEDLGTGGRVWYLSNMPITKNPTTGVCTFEPGSTVYKKSGSGFFVSRDGGTTWVNGYDMSTGELVVNVLDAIGINFDWARGGTLTLGGYGNGNGVLSIQDASNVEKVHGDNTGLKVGGTTGSKIHINTGGHFDYYYDNTYCGNMTMEAHNYGTQADPDIVDSLTVQEFDGIRLETDDEKCIVDMHNGTNGWLTVQADASVDSFDLDDDNDVDDLMSGNIEYDGTVDIYSDHVGIGKSGGLNDVNGTTVFHGAALFDQRLYIDNAIYVKDSGEYKEGLWGWVSTKDGNGSKTYAVNRGIVLQTSNNTEPVYDFWHESNGSVLIVVLGVGVNTVTWSDLETPSGGGEYSFEPHIKCASGVDAPMITGMSQSGTSLTVTFTAVTAAQAGSGNECQMKLRVIV